jgi:trk system potassium uptake protein TrkA
MKIAIIGLGSFGTQIAKTLAENGHDVTAIDIDRARIDQAKASVPFAVVMDAADKESLKALGVQDMDIVVVSIGPAMEPSILTVHYLNEIGGPKIIAKALSEDHAQILEAVGGTWPLRRPTGWPIRTSWTTSRSRPASTSRRSRRRKASSGKNSGTST